MWAVVYIRFGITNMCCAKENDRELIDIKQYKEIVKSSKAVHLSDVNDISRRYERRYERYERYERRYERYEWYEWYEWCELICVNRIVVPVAINVDR